MGEWRARADAIVSTRSVSGFRHGTVAKVKNANSKERQKRLPKEPQHCFESSVHTQEAGVYQIGVV